MLLRVQRAIKRWRQERTAQELGWTFYRYLKVERAEVSVTEGEILDLATVFGLSLREVRKAVSATRTWRDGASA